jgi:hypothetical protein
MGLDSVEFIFAIEDAFGIAIPNPDAEQMLTPRHVVDYLVARLPASEAPVCSEQRAFYRIRRAVVRTYGLPRTSIRPETPWDEILPTEYPARAWQQLQKVVGVADWPKYRVLWTRSVATTTVGATARSLASTGPAALKAHGEGWSRDEIEEIVRHLMEEELGIKTFSWDDRFHKDLGVQ